MSNSLPVLHPRRMLYILVVLLCLSAVAIMFIKIYFYGFSLNDQNSFYYQVDSWISFEPEAEQAARFSLTAPSASSGFVFGLDLAASDAFRVQEIDGRRRMVLTLPAPVEQQKASCRFRVVPASSTPAAEPPPEKVVPPMISDASRAVVNAVLEKIDPEKALTPDRLTPVLLRELGTLPRQERQMLVPNAPIGEETAYAATMILQSRGIPARIVRGIQLDEKRSAQQPELCLDVWFHNDWHIYRPATGEKDLPAGFLILQRGDRSLYEASGVKRSSILFTVTRVPAGADQLNRIRAQMIGDRELYGFSMFSLPASQQNMFQHLALLPLAILLIVLLRNVIGIPTMGTFMPVLIAMAFLEMELLPGLINFALILTVGLAIRSWLSRLNLLMVPRISAVVVVVILLMQLISMAANFFKLPALLEATIFPIVIIAWTIERASTTWEEDGAKNTLKLLVASTGAAAVCYFVLSNSALQHLLYTFAELNLVILGIILLLGTYTGYRVMELIRFQPLVKDK